MTPDIKAVGKATGPGGGDVVPYAMPGEAIEDPQTDRDAESKGPGAAWRFWDQQIKAALVHERRWRQEAEDCERLYFGPDQDTGEGGVAAKGQGSQVDDKTALIHGTVDVLRPLIYSDAPQPVISRRFRGDGKSKDVVATYAAEVGQRLADYLIDTSDLNHAMECARDDWLIAGRGDVRVHYRAKFAPVTGPDGLPIVGPDGAPMEAKKDESIRVTPSGWIRTLYAPTGSWLTVPWVAYETPMSRAEFARRFPECADKVTYDESGLIDASRGKGDEDRDRLGAFSRDATSGAITPSAFDTVAVWEIWCRESGEVIWWTQAYPDDVLDREPDPLHLEAFYPGPRPLLASSKGETLTPRPDIKYYENRADEIERASTKLRRILKIIAVAGLYPGQSSPEVEKLFNGDDVLIPIADWVGMLTKTGGTAGLIQWLPLEPMIKAIQALAQMREMAKMAMFEASGVSDVMRAQGDPNETATAQQIKGRYAGLRLSERQRRMAIFARDTIKLMVEVALEHFDLETIADIASLDLPLTEADRAMMAAEQQMIMAAFEQQAQQYQQMQQMAQLAEQAGAPVGQLPPAPEPPKLPDLPETSMEAILGRLKSDYHRRITVTIETQSTVLADEQADKEARIEFLKAFAMFVRDLAPLVQSGQFDFSAVKELLLFGVRGFPRARTLETMIASLPDEPQGQQPENIQLQLKQVDVELQKFLKDQDMKDSEADRQHETKMAGVKLIAEAANTAGEPVAPPAM